MATGTIKHPGLVLRGNNRAMHVMADSVNNVASFYIEPNNPSAVTPRIQVDFGNGYIKVWIDKGNGWDNGTVYHPS